MKAIQYQQSIPVYKDSLHINTSIVRIIDKTRMEKMKRYIHFWLIMLCIRKIKWLNIKGKLLGYMKTICHLSILFIAVCLICTAENLPDNSPIYKGIENLGLSGLVGVESLVDSLNINGKCGCHANCNSHRNEWSEWIPIGNILGNIPSNPLKSDSLNINPR